MSTGPTSTPSSSPPSATLVRSVTEADTAAAVGSGSLPVLGTPVVLAWCEAATCAAAAPLLEEGRTTVGTRVELEHRAASPVGAAVEVTATLTHRDGRLLRFAVQARHAADSPVGKPGAVLATGEVTRVVVDAERFLGRL
ncbi:hotdog domain-containing protein [Nocardioides sp. GY 10127]|uniref:thioesterase family protein n=1 Tax=Nocardioides sp. GY 10127 TaxID=2569762 RepID=UPI0010A8FD57|nr:hotdog domain-containing protein [Nocardioides sp. GY 10127]TIC84126.1 thioesterase [Nocardioides sp. GY 10127]